MIGRRRLCGPRKRPSRSHEDGQSLVEFSLIVPVFLVILLGLLEFGFAFDHLLTISYASREGARTGSAFANGSKLGNCNDVDAYVVSAVERVLTSEGSPVRTHLAQVSQIRIYKATTSGTQQGSLVNVWVPGNGPTIDGRQLHFARSGSNGWAICTRNNAIASPDSLGVSVSYTYQAITPLASLMRFFGGAGAANLPMTDRSVMALNPTD